MPNKTPAHLSFVMYGVCTAASMVFIHHKEQALAPITVAFYTFLFALLISFLTSFGELKKKFAQIIEAKTLVFHINWTTAIIWVATFLSLKYTTPSVCMFLFLTAHPLGLIILNRQFTSFNLMRAALFVVGAGVYISVVGRTGADYFGIAMAIVGGFFGAVYAFYSKKMQQFNAREILGLRFFLIVLLTGAVSIVEVGFPLQNIDFYAGYAAMSIFTVILPLFFLQHGIKNLSLLTASAYMPLAPVLCFVYDMQAQYKSMPPLLFIAVFMLLTAMLSICAPQSIQQRSFRGGFNLKH
jgi:drug/metabolite transporter (DMT)-like permease